MKHPPRNIVIDWLNTVWSTDLPTNSKIVACNLRRYMNSQHDMAWPSVPRIAGECGLSEQCVRKHLKILCSEGWLKQAGKSNVDTYIYQAQTPPAIIAPLQPLPQTPATIAPELNKELNNRERVRETRFSPPSLTEVIKYAQDKKYTGFDHETFVDFYESKGWMVGKNKMKDWKAAVRNWNKRNQHGNSQGHSQRGKDTGRLSAVGKVKAARERARVRQQGDNVGAVGQTN